MANSKRLFQYHTPLAHFETLILERIEKEETFILAGRCSDHTSYREHVATREAFKTALNDLSEALKTYLQEDDDEEPSN